MSIYGVLFLRGRPRETKMTEFHIEIQTNRQTGEGEKRRSRIGIRMERVFIGTLGMYVMSWRVACLPSMVYTEK